MVDNFNARTGDKRVRIDHEICPHFYRPLISFGQGNQLYFVFLFFSRTPALYILIILGCALLTVLTLRK